MPTSIPCKHQNGGGRKKSPCSPKITIISTPTWIIWKANSLPPNISTNSGPAIARKGTLASVATALASRVLPQPGGPSSRAPRGILAPSSWRQQYQRNSAWGKAGSGQRNPSTLLKTTVPEEQCTGQSGQWGRETLPHSWRQQYQRNSARGKVGSGQRNPSTLLKEQCQRNITWGKAGSGQKKSSRLLRMGTASHDSVARFTFMTLRLHSGAGRLHPHYRFVNIWGNCCLQAYLSKIFYKRANVNWQWTNQLLHNWCPVPQGCLQTLNRQQNPRTMLSNLEPSKGGSLSIVNISMTSHDQSMSYLGWHLQLADKFHNLLGFGEATNIFKANIVSMFWGLMFTRWMMTKYLTLNLSGVFR